MLADPLIKQLVHSCATLGGLLNAVNLYEWLCRHYGESFMALVDVDSSRLVDALLNDVPYEAERDGQRG